MTFLSPFNVRSPVFFVELFQAGHIINYFRFRRVATGMVVLGRADNKVDDIRKTAATATAFGHGMIDLDWNYKLPTVLIKQCGDGIANFGVGNVIAAADEHFRVDPET
jgi:hypothetical protein